MLKYLFFLISIFSSLNGYSQNLDNKWRLSGNLKTGNYFLTEFNSFTGLGLISEINTLGGRGEMRVGRFLSPKIGINLEFISFWINDKKNIFPQQENQLANAFLTYTSLSVQRFFSTKKMRPFLKSEIALETTKRTGSRLMNSSLIPVKKSQLTFNIGAGFSWFLKNYQAYDIGVQFNLLDWKLSKKLYRDGFPIAYFRTSILHDFKRRKDYKAVYYPLIPKRQIEVQAQAGSYFEFTGIYRQRIGKKMRFGAGISIINEEIGILPYLPVWETWNWLTEFELILSKNNQRKSKIKLPVPRLIYEGKYGIGAFDQFLIAGGFRNDFSALLIHAKPFSPLRISYGLSWQSHLRKVRGVFKTDSQTVFRGIAEYFVSQNFSLKVDTYFAVFRNFSEEEAFKKIFAKNETVFALNFYFQSPKDISLTN